jgi:hypothetical protein
MSAAGRVVVLLAPWLVCALSPSPAWAAAKKAKKAVPATAAPSGATSAARAAAPDCPKERALAYFDAGEKYFAAGDYEHAVIEYAAAYSCRAAPAFLFNIGQGFRLLGDCGRAMKYYDEYLRLKPDAPNRTAVESGSALCLDAVKEGRSRPHEIHAADDLLTGRKLPGEPGSAGVFAHGDAALVPPESGVGAGAGGGSTGAAPAEVAVAPLASSSPPPEAGVGSAAFGSGSAPAPGGGSGGGATASPGHGSRALLFGLVGGAAAVVVAGVVVTLVLVLRHPWEPDATIPID